MNIKSLLSIFKKRRQKDVSKYFLPEVYEIEELIVKGSFDLALNQIKHLEKQQYLDQENLIKNKIQKSIILHELNFTDEGLLEINNLISEIIELKHPLLMCDALLTKAYILVKMRDLIDVPKILEQAESQLNNVKKSKLPEYPVLNAFLYFTKGLHFRLENKLDKALELLHECITIRVENNRIHQIADPLNIIGYIHFAKGDKDLALEYYLKSLEAFEKIGNKPSIIKLFSNIGLMYWEKGELNIALEFCHKALDLNISQKNEKLNAGILLNIGLILVDRGKLNEALEYYDQSRISMEKINFLDGLLSLNNNIGIVYDLKGEPDNALKFFNQSLEISEKIGYKHETAKNLHNIGIAYRLKGDFDKSLEYLNNSLHISNDITKSVLSGKNLYNLILTSIYLGKKEDAKAYQQQLFELEEREKEPRIDQYYRMGKAMILKASDRLVQKAEAQVLFQQIIEEDILEYHETISAMLHLSELLLIELKSTGNESAFLEADNLINKIYKTAREQNSHSLIIETLLLRAKFSLIKGEINRSNELISEAFQSAESKGLVLLADKAKQEKIKLEEDINRWDELSEQGVSLRERMKQAKIEDYIELIKNKFNM
ncbi:MAG: tetratricopeptide repeat protein [Candidatus Kariarchaeaceae archaeon]|jgi:tetratricopeptide (TPR) repeat protein